MTTPARDEWPEEWHERMEAKLDAYREAHYQDVAELDGRLRKQESEWGLFKKVLFSVGTFGLPAAWTYLKSKLGNQ